MFRRVRNCSIIRIPLHSLENESISVFKNTVFNNGNSTFATGHVLRILKRNASINSTVSTNSHPHSNTPMLKDIESHFKMATIRMSLKNLSARVTTEEFIDYCENVLHSDEMTSIEDSAKEAREILEVLHRVGEVYWCQTSDQVWIATEHMRRRILQNVFCQDVADAIIYNNPLKLERYNTLKNEVLPLHEKYLKIYADARCHADYWTYFGAGALTFQGIVMAHMTWNLYGWDVIEPVTYFSGFTVALGSFMFFTFWKRDYEYRTAAGLITDTVMSKLLKKEDFPIETYRKLLLEWEQLCDEIQKESSFMYGGNSKKLNHILDLTYLVEEKLSKNNFNESKSET